MAGDKLGARVVPWLNGIGACCGICIFSLVIQTISSVTNAKMKYFNLGQGHGALK